MIKRALSPLRLVIVVGYGVIVALTRELTLPAAIAVLVPVLACFVVARIVGDATSGHETLSPEQRQTRAQGVKHWLGAATVPASVRNALSRLADATANDDRSAVKTALDSVIAVTANQLDSGARLELARLAQAIAGQGSS